MDEKYKAALDLAKSYYPDNPFLDTIFPELAESEDERVRQWIREHINHDGTNMFDKAVAWLEKQKEASKAIEAVDRIDKYIDAHLANAHDMKNSNPDKKYYRGWDDALGRMARILQKVYSAEKQKEQKSVERATMQDFNYHDGESDEKAWSRLLAILNYAGATSNDTPGEEIQALINWIEEKHKPAEWSELDEQMYEGIIYDLQKYGDHYFFPIGSSAYNWLKTRFKYLRPIQQGWSEEDEKLLNYAVSMTDDAQVRRFLKSLRPSWKPSEAQKNALKEVLDMAEAYGILQKMGRTYDDIIELQNDLEEEF